MRQQHRFGVKPRGPQVLRKHLFALLKGGLMLEDAARVIIFNGNPCNHAEVTVVVMPLFIEIIGGIFVPLEHTRLDELKIPLPNFPEFLNSSTFSTRFVVFRIDDVNKRERIGIQLSPQIGRSVAHIRPRCNQVHLISYRTSSSKRGDLSQYSACLVAKVPRSGVICNDASRKKCGTGLFLGEGDDFFS